MKALGLGVVCAAATLAMGTTSFAGITPSATDLGTLDGSTIVVDFTIAPNEIAWFSFETTAVFDPTYLDLTTSSDFTLIDTEIGLYDSLGNLVANDDDNGIGLASTLSFGAGSGLMLGDSFNLGGNGLAEGENGDLANPGTYFLAVGEFNVDFGAINFDVVSTGSDTGGDIQLTIYNNVIPAPGALCLLGLAGLVGTRRRK